MGFFRRFRDAAACVVLLALPFFFLEANLKNPAKTNFVDRAVLSFSAPIQYLAKQVAGGVSGVLERYVALAREDTDPVSEKIHPRVAHELESARKVILRITGQAELLHESPVIRKSISLRNPYTDVLNLLQIELLRRYREAPDEEGRERLRPALFLSVNGIAAALQSTG